MYKQHTEQAFLLESSEMFGSLPLDSSNDWINLSKLVPWRELDAKYVDNFKSMKGQSRYECPMTIIKKVLKITDITATVGIRRSKSSKILRPDAPADRLRRFGY